MSCPAYVEFRPASIGRPAPIRSSGLERDLPAKLAIALVGLLAKAFRYTPVGGRVSLRVARDAERAVTISVTDTGPGIDPAEEEVIFERSYRGASSQGDGQGAGLAIVRSILHLRGGRAALHSAPALGTTATLAFPDEMSSR